jgi:peptide/nickel transport system substrate-binding protein
MSEPREHPYIPKLKQQFAEGKCDRREFLRTATLLGVSAGAAYGFVGKVTGESFTTPARAAMPKGGTLRIGMEVQDLSSPHTYSWGESDITRQVCEYMTRTGQDNITRPSLCERWEVSPDLKTWTLKLRKDVKWHNGRAFTADDVIWNLQHALDPKTGSSMVGLMKGYMLNDIKVDGEDSTEIWDANALEKVDDHTVRINAKAPQLAVPEHLFHYPMHIIDPEEGGKFGPGSNGTGPFELVDTKVGIKAVLKARQGYWGPGPYIDTLEYVDLGDEGSARTSALASKQVHGVRSVDLGALDLLKKIPHVQIYQVATAQTGVARVKTAQKPFDDPRVRKALRLAVDTKAVLKLAYRDQGLAAQHHHVCDIHPEYANLPHFGRDVAGAKKLLAEAGHSGGVDLEIACKPDPAWELTAVQAMVEQWKDAGIRVKINVMPSAQFWDVWDKVPFGFTEWTHRPLGVMVLALAYRGGVPWNESGYANPEFDRLLAKAEGLADVEKRRVVMADIQKLMQEDGPITQPIWRGVFTAFDKRVKGFQMHPTEYLFAEELALES